MMEGASDYRNKLTKLEAVRLLEKRLEFYTEGSRIYGCLSFILIFWLIGGSAVRLT
jgi:hypothetical protein